MPRGRGPTTQRVSWDPLERYALRYVKERALDETSGYTDNTYGNMPTPSTAAARVIGIDRSHWYHWRQRGFITLRRADRFAAHLGVHPSEIWGDEWSNVPAGEHYDDEAHLLDFTRPPRSAAYLRRHGPPHQEMSA